MEHTIWVIVRKSDGKFLRKNPRNVNPDWKLLKELETRDTLTHREQILRDQNWGYIEDYFTEKLGEARIMASKANAVTHCPRWHNWIAPGTYLDVNPGLRVLLGE